ncbi:hypothetical protein ACYSMR_09655 [Kocuria sp. U4B]
MLFPSAAALLRGHGLQGASAQESVERLERTQGGRASAESSTSADGPTCLTTMRLGRARPMTPLDREEPE